MLIPDLWTSIRTRPRSWRILEICPDLRMPLKLLICPSSFFSPHISFQQFKQRCPALCWGGQWADTRTCPANAALCWGSRLLGEAGGYRAAPETFQIIRARFFRARLSKLTRSSAIAHPVIRLVMFLSNIFLEVSVPAPWECCRFKDSLTAAGNSSAN